MKNLRSPFDDQLSATPEGKIAWNEEQAILDVTEMIREIMQAKSISRSQLAEKLGISKGRVSQILDGTANITIRTLARILIVLGYEFRPACVAINGENELRHDTGACRGVGDDATRDSAERLMPSNADLMKLPDSPPAAEWWDEESPF